MDAASAMDQQAQLTCVAYSADGRMVLGGSCNCALLAWSSASGERVGELCGHSGDVLACSVARATVSGQWLGASGAADCDVVLWDLGGLPGQGSPVTVPPLTILKGHTGYVRAVRFAPDSGLLVSASDDTTAIVWDPLARVALRTLRGHTQYINGLDCAQSPQGLLVATASYDRTVALWDARQGKRLYELRGHSGGVLSCSLSPDGSHLASGSADDSVIVWSLATREQEFVLRGHQNTVRAVEFFDGGARLLTGSHDNTVRLWSPRRASE